MATTVPQHIALSFGELISPAFLLWEAGCFARITLFLFLLVRTLKARRGLPLTVSLVVAGTSSRDQNILIQSRYRNVVLELSGRYRLVLAMYRFASVQIPRKAATPIAAFFMPKIYYTEFIQ